MSELIKKAGFELVHDVNKWYFLDFDKNDEPLSQDQSKEEAIAFFNKNILPELKKNSLIINGFAPTKRILIKIGYQNFIIACKVRGIKYNDILKGANLKINREIGKWFFLDFDENGKPLTKEQRLIVAASYFKTAIIPHLIASKKLKINDSPDTSIKDKIYQNFLGAIFRRSINFNELLTSSEFEINIDTNKWSFLYYNESGESLTYDEKKKIASEYFKNVIIPDLIKKKYIKEGQTPSLSMLSEEEHISFFHAITRLPHRLSYNEIVMEAGFAPNESNVYKAIGNYYDKIVKYLFLIHTRNKNCTSFCEIRPTPYDKKLHSRHCENTIIIDKIGNFEKLSSKTFNFVKEREDIIIINIDYKLIN